MKYKIHPEYKIVTITCTCGNVIQTRSTKGENYVVEICSACHPFYKGAEEEKIVDRFGMVEKFRKRYGNKMKGA